MNICAVGIDVSKGKSTVAIVQPDKNILYKSFEVKHTIEGIKSLVQLITSLPHEVAIIMEHTGHYFEPLVYEFAKAKLFVSVVNPKLIKDYSNNSLRKLKSDNADALKIARYGIDNWHNLKEYSPMDELRKQLKILNRQYQSHATYKTAFINNLISLLDQTYPGIDKYFNSPVREDGSQKWIDFANTYWHVDCVRSMSLNAFIDHYQRWCKRKKYNFSKSKAEEIYGISKELIPVLPKDKFSKFLLKQAIDLVNNISKSQEVYKSQMNEIASQLPEYPVVMEMKGVGPCLGPQLMAEIGDVTRFNHKGALSAFAGVDPGVNQSGNYNQKSVRSTKRGSPHLRRTLFLVVSALIKTKPQDDDVYLFIDKKRAEGKEYYVYMTAGANKFLRVYYGKVKGYLASLDE